MFCHAFEQHGDPIEGVLDGAGPPFEPGAGFGVGEGVGDLIAEFGAHFAEEVEFEFFGVLAAEGFDLGLDLGESHGYTSSRI